MPTRRPARRRGSVLLVVLGLMGMLLLIGITFYSFAIEEQRSSTYYADSSKVLAPALDADTVFDFALEQIILGTTTTDNPATTTIDESQTNSALWGRRHSLLGTSFGINSTGSTAYQGFDLTPYNGAGVNLILDSNPMSPNYRKVYLDMDHDNTADAYQGFNYSAAANGGTAATVPTVTSPDTDYSQADMNNLFLAYIGKGLDTTGNQFPVIIPSFHRPEMLRDAGAPISNWHSNSSTATRVLRPHPSHTYKGSTVARFLSASTTNSLGLAVQPFPFSSGISQGVWDLSAPPGSTPAAPTLDADNDGDGTKEGIWMDVDFPVQTLPDGRMCVPLISATIIDAEGLINLNATGNISGAQATMPFGQGNHISRSNLGLSRSEINPAWGLWASPGNVTTSVLNQYRIHWNVPSASYPTGSAGADRRELADMDLLHLNLGRAQFTQTSGGSWQVTGLSGLFEPTGYDQGRYGELFRVSNNVFAYGSGAASFASGYPVPGQNGTDDDSDNAVGYAYYDDLTLQFAGLSGLRSRSNSMTGYFTVPNQGHPYDYSAIGSAAQLQATGARTARATIGGNPTLYAAYPSGGAYSTQVSPGSQYQTIQPTLVSASTNAQTDEADELLVDWGIGGDTDYKARLKSDAIFSPDEMLGLHGSNADLITTGITSSIQSLAPANFDANSSAADIRKQFTVVSHDRQQFGLVSSGTRSWEFNADTNSNGLLEFPPIPSAMTGSDPFRASLRAVLFSELNRNTSNSTLTQLRKNLNLYLEDNYQTLSDPNGVTANVPVYRPLTPHPTSGLGATPITSTGVYPPTTAAQQEWWARVDRQKMARDIYVMLYMFGGGNDGVSYATTANQPASGVRPLHRDARLQEMAQFAVNYVDALDRDDVITRFEYDKDLSDGWNLDDNAFADESSGLTYPNDRAVVHGVEAQRLTLSEVALIISRRVGTTGMYQDHPATEINDSQGAGARDDRYLSYIELRNPSAFSTSFTTGAWQLAVVDIDPMTSAETDRVQLTPMTGSVASGAQFVIGNRGGPQALDPSDATRNLPSTYRVDPTWVSGNTPAFVNIAPYSGTINMDLIPTLAASNHDATQSRLTDGTASGVVGLGTDINTAGNFLYSGNVSAAQEAATHTFVLRRRLDLNRTSPVTYSSNAAQSTSENNDNPWVEVDRFTADWRTFALSTSSDDNTLIQAQLSNLSSKERSEPFARYSGEATYSGATGASHNYALNSLGDTRNSNSPAAFTRLQTHFDRDYASPADLLALPLYGPDKVTTRVGQIVRYDDPLINAASDTAYIAMERFMRPYNRIASPADVNLDNRWYRLLNFLEVPTRTNAGLTTLPYAVRSPGVLNLNTIRHRAALGALIDDVVYDPGSSTFGGHLNPDFSTETTMLYDRYEGNTRDWWFQFLYARDGVDPMTNLILPGTTAAKPFRSLHFADNGVSSIESTVMRLLPNDNADAVVNPPAPAPSQVRGMFEARARSDLAAAGGSELIDPYSRLRILRKVMNNSTTRSNVFLCWITVGFFEAVQQTTGEVQIGAKLAGAEDVRGFFILDRSLPEHCYNTQTQTFDFKKFILYRKKLQ